MSDLARMSKVGRDDAMAKRKLMYLALAVALLMATSAVFGEEIGPRIIVKLKPGATAAGLSAYAREIDGLRQDGRAWAEAPLFPEYASRQSLSTGGGSDFPRDRYRIVILDENADREAVLEELNRLADVEYAEFDYPIQLFARPNDPGLPNEWGLENNGQQYLGIWRRDGF
jgi:hypothetical protein